jgi:hypothetical protein
VCVCVCVYSAVSAEQIIALISLRLINLVNIYSRIYRTRSTLWYIRYKLARNLTSYVVKQLEINRLDTYQINPLAPEFGI